MKAGRIVTDTTGFFEITSGDIIEIGGRRFRVTGNEMERRFGVEDPKYWVKRVVEDATGARKIVKLSFLETFQTTISGVPIRCFRDPDKEGDILDLVRGRPDFMQGEVFRDSRGNNIRVLDVVRGANFYVAMGDYYSMPHRAYYEKILPGMLAKLLEACRSIRFLHMNGFRHGDIRNDHLMIEKKTGNYVWIDFDYDYDAPENPFSLDLFGLGNLLLYAVGKGFHDLYLIRHEPDIYGDFFDQITEEDMSLLDASRFVNLRKLYPYLPRMLNDILLHFSRGTTIYYEFIDEIIEDLEGFLRSL
ncbi:protein kinase [Desulfobotulus sp. H1]|uniref:Protein kinase n=1 Tax=Desulfobotulus pelophilus TaxID=2823377 RepID=A0ABT3N6G7_9BACT|nr:protein kinase [Desulfobotulus pelophilus]MCW7752627.1 protein kinase [Desulfobotulus pelophilus]